MNSCGGGIINSRMEGVYCEM